MELMGRLKCTLGASSVFAAVPAWMTYLVNRGFATTNPYLSPFVADTRCVWTIGSSLGIVLGARNSAKASGTLASKPKPTTKTIAKNATAGFIMVLGTRIAGGCTSGHGITGMAQLGLGSFLTVAAMFASGFLTSKIADLVL
jgi:uncharacterized protein